jgi:hypothetical protein
MDKILRLFEENNYTQTKQKLEELENERSKRIWGD